MGGAGRRRGVGERLARGERLLGAYVGDLPLAGLDLDDLALVVLPARRLQHAVLPRSVAVAVTVADVADVAEAARSGLDAVVTGIGAPPAEDVTAAASARGLLVLSAGGPDGVALVASPEAARQAFRGGARVVLLDLRGALAAAVAAVASTGGPGGLEAPPAPRPSREPLVLLSGMLGDAELWRDVAAQLADVALPWPARIDLDDSVPEMAASVLAAAPPTFALVGHSLGAIVALEIARRAPGRIARLALVNASARGPSSGQLESWSLLRQRVDAGDFAGIARELAAATLAPPRRADASLRARNEAMAHAVGPDGLRRQLAAQASRPDSRPALAAVTVATLVLSGDADEICPPHLQQELADGLPDARLVTVAGGGHMLPLECPGEVAGLLREHLRPAEQRQ